MSNKNLPTTKIGYIIKAVTENRLHDLDDSDQALLEKISFADDVIRIHGAGKKSKQLIMEKFDLSPSMANNLIRDAQMYYGSTVVFEKTYWKSFAVEGLVKVINAARDSFLTEEGKLKEYVNGRDLKALAELMKELRQTIGYDEIEQHDQEEQMPDVVVLTTDIAVLGLKPTGLSREEIIRRFHKTAEDVHSNEQD